MRWTRQYFTLLVLYLLNVPTLKMKSLALDPPILFLTTTPLSLRPLLLSSSPLDLRSLGFIYRQS